MATLSEHTQNKFQSTHTLFSLSLHFSISNIVFISLHRWPNKKVNKYANTESKRVRERTVQKNKPLKKCSHKLSSPSERQQNKTGQRKSNESFRTNNRWNVSRSTTIEHTPYWEVKPNIFGLENLAFCLCICVCDQCAHYLNRKWS